MFSFRDRSRRGESCAAQCAERGRPAYNAARRLRTSLPPLSTGSATSTPELIVVDDGSGRRHFRGRGRPPAGLPAPKSCGSPWQRQGAAVRAGVAHARGRSIVHGRRPGDDLCDLPALLAALETADVAIVARPARGHGRRAPPRREPGWSGVQPVGPSDHGARRAGHQCGFKAFRRTGSPNCCSPWCRRRLCLRRRESARCAWATGLPRCPALQPSRQPRRRSCGDSGPAA